MKFLNSLWKHFLDFFQVSLITICVFIVIYILLGQFAEVTGSSMFPNLENKEHLLAQKVFTKFDSIKRGDVVILKHPFEQQKLIVKRAIGLPGETIEIVDDKVMINGKYLQEPYLANDMTTPQGQFMIKGVAYKIPQDSYVVMGDNRVASTDSREWGFVNKDLIIARVVVVFYPFNKVKFIPRTDIVEATSIFSLGFSQLRQLAF